MVVLSANNWCTESCFKNNTILLGVEPFGLKETSHVFSSQLPHRFVGRIVGSASRKSAKKSKGNKEKQKDVILQNSNNKFDDCNALKKEPTSIDERITGGNSITIPSRETVIQACSVTSGLLVVLGLMIRQVSHVASSGGFPISDCSVVSFGFETWHLELIAALVISISLSRYILLKTWPDFSESSEAANRQVLTSLQTPDYMIVAFLPGISEELLFRGGLLPLVGLDWKGALAVATLFGILHLGNGRKFSFAIWATFVGLAYGYGTIASSSLIVPMASHALNNFVGALLWGFTSRSSQEIKS